MKQVVMILLFTILVEEGQAQRIFTSLQQVWEYADKNNLTLQQRKLDQETSEKDQQIARSGLLPRINFFSTADYYPIIPSMIVPDKVIGGTQNKFTKVQFGLPLNFTTGAEFSMPLINFEKWESLKKAAFQTEGVKWNTEAEKEKLHNQLTGLYYKAVLTQELLQLNKENEQVMDSLLQMLNKRRKN